MKWPWLGLSALFWASDSLAERAYVPPRAQDPMNQIVIQEILPTLDALFGLVAAHGLDTTMDGVPVFRPRMESQRDRFLPGKVALGFAQVLVARQSDPGFERRYLEKYRAVVRMLLAPDGDSRNAMPNDTWGIYYYVSAIHKLKAAGLLDGQSPAIDPQDMAALKEQNDWRHFVHYPGEKGVEPSLFYTLKGSLPTNYYGVAFGVAALRELLEWDDRKEAHSDRLLEKMVYHYGKYGGERHWSDETSGQRRFDRYSVLLIAEIAQRFIATGREREFLSYVHPDFPDLKLADVLRQSVEFMFQLANVSGNGFNYGRSLGPYADTAALEVLSAAAYLSRDGSMPKLLTSRESQFAYAFATRVNAKLADFWIDRRWLARPTGEPLAAFNLWTKGRRPDAYRAKHRILGDNLSLLLQVIYTNEIWNAIGFKDRRPMADENFRKVLKAFEPYKLITFSKANAEQPSSTRYDAATLVVRDGAWVLSLPLVNGGTSLYRYNPYFPVPQSTLLLDGAPDQDWPQLLPQFILDDGSTLLPLSFLKDIAGGADGETSHQVTYRQDGLCRVSGETPVEDGRIKVNTTYRFKPGEIEREDTFTVAEPVGVKRITMQFATYSTEPETHARGQIVQFAKGAIRSIEASGLGTAVVDDVSQDERYNTPNGALRTRATWTTGPILLSPHRSMTLAWKLRYRLAR